jgi:hypothetical protein
MAVETQEFPVVSSDVRVQRLYEESRREGTSHKLAEMFALRQFPGLRTERTFYRMNHIGTLADQFAGEEHNLEILAAKAKAQGRTVNYTDVYNESLAKEPLDPNALVPRGQGRSYIKRVCERNDWECHGAVEVKRSYRDLEKNLKPGPRLNPEIVDKIAAQRIAQDPGLAKNMTALREEIIEKHGAPKPFTPPGA